MIHRAFMLSGAFFSIAVMTTFSRYAIKSLLDLENATASVVAVVFVAVVGLFAGLITIKNPEGY